MKVEHEYLLRSIFASVQRRRGEFGTSLVIARGEVGVDHDGVGRIVRRCRCARRRPVASNSTSRTRFVERESRRPFPRRSRPCAPMTAEQPPIGW